MNEDLEYDARLFLRSYADAFKCLNQCAQKEKLLEIYQHKANYLIKLIKKHNYETIKDNREVKLFQFSRFLLFSYFSLVFRRYFHNSDCQEHDYETYQIIFEKALQNITKDYE